MKLVVVSTFWNSEDYVGECIKSVKNQYNTNFIAYFIDDMSTDSSYEVAEQAIDGDPRFVLIKNTEKKYKCKNFIDVIRDNSKIKWNDVIVEIDGDDKLADNHVFGLINKIYMDENIWISGSKWKDTNGRSMNYGRADADRPRRTQWNFSHMRTYRAFLFRLIEDKDLKFNGEYLRAAVDLGIGFPMLEMAGNEHYYFLDEVTYIYTWHDKQSYSENGAINDKTLQGRTAKHLYSLPSYKKLVLIDENQNNTENENVPKQHSVISNPVIETKMTLSKKEINYDKINSIFKNNNPRVITSLKQPENKTQVKLNSQTIGKLLGNKKRR
jgi:glycosyltransferase involved in cell wall biosynthesis